MHVIDTNKDAVFTYEQFFRWINTPFLTIRCPYCEGESSSMFIILKDDYSEFSCRLCRAHGEVIFGEKHIIFDRESIGD